MFGSWFTHGRLFADNVPSTPNWAQHSQNLTFSWAMAADPALAVLHVDSDGAASSALAHAASSAAAPSHIGVVGSAAAGPIPSIAKPWTGAEIAVLEREHVRVGALGVGARRG